MSHNIPRDLKLAILWAAHRLLKDAGLSTKAVSTLIAQVQQESSNE